ncbi:MAG TPA: hypothetical protein VNB22_16030 [Pyrinomonadaceae bacterium]|jgi:hypothetical protein|nr:hypothetical protein [Pyrinomonadaceae bacterium]
MPTKWNRGARESGQLRVYNMGGGWSAAVNAAINTFNTLGLGVQLVAVNDKDVADIHVKLSNGADFIEKGAIKLMAGFTADQLHGRARTRASSGSRKREPEIDFAGVFLPGKVQNVTPKQKEVITVHELIHASGLDGGIPGGGQHPNMDHDDIGIMVANMKVDGDGLIEYLADKNAKPMTPIRIGAKTLCTMRMLWKNEGCEHN